MQKANWRKPSVVHYIRHAYVNHCHAKECLYPLTAGISSGKSLSSALITTVLPIICWPRKTLSFTVWTILKQEFLLFPLISPVSCSSLLLALSAQCFEHYLHADRRERHCPFPLTSIQIKFLVLQTTRNFLWMTVNRDIPLKNFQLPHQQKRCFQKRFLPSSPDKKDGSDQTKTFQHWRGSGQKANVKAYRENTHPTSIWLQGPTIWQLETPRFFLTFCSLF